MASHSIADKIVTLPTLATFKDEADDAYARHVDGVEVIEDGRSSNVAALVGTSSTLSALETGVRVGYRTLYALATNATLDLTLTDGTTTGAVPIYRFGTTRMGSHVNAGSVLMLTYFEPYVYGTTTVERAWVADNAYDSNTIGYQLRTNSTTLPMETYTRRYRLLFTGADGAGWVSANSTATNTAAANKTVNTEPIDPFGPIVYYGTTTNLDAGTAPAATALWQQYVIDLRYSFYPLTLTFPAPVYLKCQPLTYDWTQGTQGTGATMLGITQQLPTHDDGYIYLLLGIAYSATNIELRVEHPVYYYDGLDGGIQHWDGDQSISAAEIDAILAS